MEGWARNGITKNTLTGAVSEGTERTDLKAGSKMKEIDERGGCGSKNMRGKGR